MFASTFLVSGMDAHVFQHPDHRCPIDPARRLAGRADHRGRPHPRRCRVRPAYSTCCRSSLAQERRGLGARLLRPAPEEPSLYRNSRVAPRRAITSKAGTRFGRPRHRGSSTTLICDLLIVNDTSDEPAASNIVATRCHFPRGPRPSYSTVHQGVPPIGDMWHEVSVLSPFAH